MTFTARFPGGATFIIVGPHHPADVDDRESNNIEDGTSAAHGPFPHALPERMPGTSAARGVTLLGALEFSRR